SATRSEKNYPFTSHDIEVKVGRVIDEELKIPVDLSNPETTLSIEVVEGKAYMSIRRIEGLGGLPVGVSGKVVCLLSNGFDSPIAALRMMKRGCEPILVHFHSYPNTTKDAIESVKKIAEIISNYAPNPPKLLLIPFAEIQNFIVSKIPSSLRVVMYRRWMLWIAEQIAIRVRA
ncbi:MAG: THUMP domain-containing protein, partial [Patescibacteria group bacterium]